MKQKQDEKGRVDLGRHLASGGTSLHHSTALEGNTLVLREVEMLLVQGRAVGAKPQREYLEEIAVVFLAATRVVA